MSLSGLSLRVEDVLNDAQDRGRLDPETARNAWHAWYTVEMTSIEAATYDGWRQLSATERHSINAALEKIYTQLRERFEALEATQIYELALRYRKQLGEEVFEHVKELHWDGELSVAFELLVNQLYISNTRPSGKEQQIIRDLAKDWEMPEKDWNFWNIL